MDSRRLLISAFALLVTFLPSTSLAGEPLVAKALADRCDFAGALKMLRSLPDELRGHSDARLFEARLLIQLGEGDDAIAVLNQLLARAEGELRREVLLARGLALSVLDRLKEAEDDLNKAKALGADPEIVNLNIAILRLQSGNLRAAEASLLSVLREAPDLTGALYNLAVIRSGQNRVAEAAALIRQAWALGFRNPDQIRTDKGLRALRQAKGLIDDLLGSSERRCATY